MSTAFRLEELPGPIALLTMDVAEQSVNTFSRPVMTELSKVTDQLAERKDLKGLLLKSGKKGQFIAGADLKEMGRAGLCHQRRSAARAPRRSRGV